MTKYKCGCETDGVIILDSNILSTATYLEWVDSVGLNGTREQCWECWCKKPTSSGESLHQTAVFQDKVEQKK